MPVTLTAGNTSAAWTPYVTAGGGCYPNLGPVPNLRWCGAQLQVVKGGTATDWVIDSATARWGYLSVGGSTISYQPVSNGYGTDTVSYRLRSGSVYSNWATISVTVYCNTNYACR